MNVKVNDSLTRVNISELQKVTKEKHKVDKNMESKKEIRRSDIERFNEMKIRERQIRSKSEVKEKVKEVVKSIREDKNALKTMDRIDEIRDKVLTTLS